MLSHGSADLILEACTDFWDGTDIYPLSGSDRCRNSYTPSIFVALVPFAFPFSHHLLLLLLQKEGSGFLPASLSVRLLLSIRLQAHAGVLVQRTEWKVRGAGSRSLLVHWSRSSLHYSHQTQLMQKQLEFRWYYLLLKRHRISCSVANLIFHYLSSIISTEGIGEGVEREDCVQALSGQIFMGMVSSQFQARLDTVRLIDALVTACIRFVYFSMEDELRSKVNAYSLYCKRGTFCCLKVFFFGFHKTTSIK